MSGQMEGKSLPTPGAPMRAISLFTGAGGMDFGFEAAGYRIAVALELDPDAALTYRTNRPDTPLIPFSAVPFTLPG